MSSEVSKPEAAVGEERLPTNPTTQRWTRWLGSQRDTLGTVVAIVLILLFWRFAGQYLPTYIFPTIPIAIDTTIELLGQHATYISISETLVRILGGFAVSAVFGIAVGVVMATSPLFNFFARPLIRLIMGVPALTWVLLGVLWFRNMEVRVWFFMFIITFPITALNTYDGVRSVSYELYQMTKALRPTQWGMLKFLIIPAATPFIFSALRLSLSFAGRIAVFAEAISAGTGIGAEMMLTNQLFDTAGLIAWTFMLIVMLSTMDGILELLEKRWFKWRREMKE
jgi:NitT/TauT family transport system permease protein